jgi:hypothetical protein
METSSEHFGAGSMKSDAGGPFALSNKALKMQLKPWPVRLYWSELNGEGIYETAHSH